MTAKQILIVEDEEIVARTVIPETPVRVEYELTAKGRALGAVIVTQEKTIHVRLDPTRLDALKARQERSLL